MTRTRKSGPERSVVVDGAVVCGVQGELTETDVEMFRQVIEAARRLVEARQAARDAAGEPSCACEAEARG